MLIGEALMHSGNWSIAEATMTKPKPWRPRPLPGCASLPAVVRRPIKEFGVRPLTPTWQARLTEVESVFEAGAIGG